MTNRASRSKTSLQDQKEMQKVEEKKLKDRQKIEDKLKKEIRSEIRKSRSEAAQVVLNAFDREEDDYELLSPEDLPDFNSNSNSILSTLSRCTSTSLLLSDSNPFSRPSCFLLKPNDLIQDPSSISHELLEYLVSGSDPLDLDSLLKVSSALHLFSKMISLNLCTDPRSLLKHLLLLSSTPPAPSSDPLDPPSASLLSQWTLHFSQAQAYMDYLHLSLCVPLSDLLWLSLSSEDSTSSSWAGWGSPPPSNFTLSPENRSPFPLNQVTWPEVARMSLLAFLSHELGRSKETIQHVLRGSKQAFFRTSKSITRNIRLRLALGAQHTPPSFYPTSEDLLLLHSLPPDLSIENQSGLLSPSPPSLPPQLDDLLFQSESELITALLAAASPSSPTPYPESYRRCCLVLVKLLGLSQSKHMIWEVDRNFYPEYYSSIRQPTMFINVALRLLQRGYGSDPLSPYLDIASQFYRDAKQVLLNCFSFNSEQTSLVAQAQKILQALSRHFQRWVLPTASHSLRYLPESCCDDHHCLLSGSLLNLQPPINAIKCGRCSGSFSLDSIYTCLDSLSLPLPSSPPLSSSPSEDSRDIWRFIIAPSQEQVDQSHEDWFCPFCLSEDSSGLSSDPNQPEPPSLFRYDEWGPSSLLPWTLNPNHSTTTQEIESSRPDLLPVLNALRILSSPWLASHPSKHDDKAVSRDWTASDHLSVLLGLTSVLAQDPASFTYLHSLRTECEKLLDVVNKPSFLDAEALEIVRGLLGRRGEQECRALLDGISNRDLTEPLELDSEVATGRCLVCLGSSLLPPPLDDQTMKDPEAESASEQEQEESEEEYGSKRKKSRGRNLAQSPPPPTSQAILCDGCNAEAHLKCLGMSEVPSSTWLCPPCESRRKENSPQSGSQDLLLFLAAEAPPASSVSTDLSAGLGLGSSTVWGAGKEPLDGYRSREREEALMSSLLEKRVLSELDESDQIESPNHHQVCRYCNLTEDALCSPLVIGQSRDEHDRWVSCGQNPPLLSHPPLSAHSLELSTPTSLSLLLGNCPLPPRVSVPFFPSQDSIAGLTIRTAQSLSSLPTSPLTCPIVHETCALLMFQCRLERDQHKLRRKRQRVGNQMVSRVGVGSLYLGSYSLRSFWSFPGSDDIWMNSLSDRSEWSRITDKPSLFLLLEELQNSHTPSSVQLRRSLSLHHFPSPSHPNPSMDSIQPSPLLPPSLTPSKLDGRRKKVMTLSLLEEGKDIDLCSPLQVLPCECVQLPCSPPNPQESEEDPSNEIFSLTKRFYGLTVLNEQGEQIKPPRGVTVVFQVRCEGNPAPIYSTQLSEIYKEKDPSYYFASLVFNRSGIYHLSFFVQGSQAHSIRPLTRVVTVLTERLLCGWGPSLAKLNAAHHYDRSNNRQIQRNRDALLSQIRERIFQPLGICETKGGELDAIKAALLIFYAALPAGSLQLDTDHGLYLEASSNAIDLSQVEDPSRGWNCSIDQVWRERVESATKPQQLMECLLLLEQYILEKWMDSSLKKTLSVLPNPHFALRCSTFSSIAIRLFSLDKAILYSKVVQPPRPKRVESFNIGPSSLRLQQRPRPSYRDMDSEGEGEEEEGTPQLFESSGPRTRTRRTDLVDTENLETSRSLRPRKQVAEKYSDEEDFDPNVKSWECPNCGNDCFQKSCSECGSKRKVTQKKSRRGRRKSFDSEEEDFSEEDSFQSDFSEDEDEESTNKRKSPRDNPEVYYGEEDGSSESNFFVLPIEEFHSELDDTCRKSMLSAMARIHSIPNPPTDRETLAELWRIWSNVQANYYGEDLEHFKSDIQSVPSILEQDIFNN